MTALAVMVGVAIFLLALLVVGLLRSHAEILRQLHDLGAGRDELARPAPPVVVAAGAGGSSAFDLAGRTPLGDAIAVAVAGAGQDTLLAFLSSTCLTCGGFWQTLAGATELGLPRATRVVAVAKGAGDESASALRRVAAAGLTVVMSTQAWLDYQVPGSPYFVVVSGQSGRVVAEGTAASWEQVVGLVGAPRDDGVVRRAGMQDHVEDLRNAARIDADLSAAGIQAGDASLYPTSPPVQS